MKFAKIILKLAICITCIYLFISCFTPNVLSQIGKLQAFGLNRVTEINGYRPEWEWPGALDTFGSHTLEYKEEYMKEDIVYISLRFQHNSNDVDIYSKIYLSDADQVRMGLNAYYDYGEKKLTYDPVYIQQIDTEESEIYSDEKSVDEYLHRYGLTRQDVKEYQNYAIYDVIVKTWTKTYKEFYWLERLKVKMCRTVDNTFQFEEESITR